MSIIVIDTNIFLAALSNPDNAARELLRQCLQGKHTALMGNTLLLEYEDVLSREALFKKCPLDANEREQLLNAFISVCHWIPVYYLWRPNLKDEGDNHLIELALAGNAQWLISRNLKDFRNSQLLFPELQITDPATFLETIRGEL